MKKIFALFALALAVAACAPAEAADEGLPSGAVRHVVVFKFAATATPEQIQQVTDGLRTLKDRIPGIIDFEHGVNESPEGKDQGHNHVYLLTFESAAARDAYLPHPEHVAFGQMLGSLGINEGVFVVDYAPGE